jgi:NitT/TauT family transport system permease protein
MTTQHKTKSRIVPIVTLAIVLLLWEFGSRVGVIPAVFFPAPTKIFEALVKLTKNGDLFTAFSATMVRFLAGVICGALTGAVIGLMMGWWPKVNSFLAPWIAAFYPIPKIAIFPLLMIIFGIGEGSKFVAILLAAFFPMLIATQAGVNQISRIYFEVGQNYGVKGRQIFTHILLPGSLPSMMAGLKMATTTGFVIAISVEVISAKAGLGVLLWFGWQTFRVSELYAVLVIISLLGILMNYIIEKATARLVPWMGE